MFENLGIHDYNQYLLAVIAIIIMPGPNSIFVLTSSIKYGIARGYQAAMGVFLGDAIIVFCVYLGVAALINSSPFFYNSLRFFSAGFLLYLALQILYGIFLSSQTKNRTVNQEIPLKNENLFFKALTLSLTNPKALLFFFAFFHKFIDPSYNPTYLPFLILGITLSLISFSYLTSLIIGGNVLINFIKKHQWLNPLGNVIVALIFIGFGIQLLLN